MKRAFYATLSITLLIGLTLSCYLYLVLGWVQPGVQGKFFDFKRKVQGWHYGTLLRDPNERKLRWSPVPIDIVIPAIAKDHETLHWAVKNARIFVMHNIGNIYIVSRPNDEVIKEFAKQNDCIFIEENTVLPNFANQPRHGWIIQQFIKLNADSFVKNDHFLVLDADTILIRPMTFLRKGALYLQFHNDYGYMRKKAAGAILQFSKVHNMDFTAHHMLFEKSKLAAMKQHIEKIHHQPWYEVVLNQEDVAEYELYANFMLHFYPNQTHIIAAKNQGILRKQFNKGFQEIQNFLSRKYRSVSAHSFWPESEI